MTLHLDARQRAMLQEMGVTVWDREPMAAPARPPSPAMDASPASPPSPIQPAAPRAAAPVAPAPVAPVPAALPAASWRLHAPQALYPTADPALTPAELGSGWLIVTESATPSSPLAGEAGKLLDNMLRAMQLHKHPHVFITTLERAAHSASEDQPIAATLADTVAQLQPALVLVLGHVAARVALAQSEPLGRLRAAPHTLAGCPAVVTYDPALILRSQDKASIKAATWIDLCRALALVRSSSHPGRSG